MIPPPGIPSFPFQVEYDRALDRYPAQLWANLSRFAMLRALLTECYELALALWRGSLNGEHGIVIEATHVQVVAQRIIEEMRRRHHVSFH